MAFSFEEIPGSRFSTYNPPTHQVRYRAVGEFSSYQVEVYALGATPALLLRPSGILYRQDLIVEEEGWSQYLVTVPYGNRDRNTGSASFSFDTSGATVSIKAAKEHIASYDSGGVSPGDEHEGAIGVKGDGDVEGIEITIPALKLTYSYRHPAGVVNEAFARSLASATGSTNSAAWRGFAAGELLYIGSSGSDGTDADAEVQHQFVGSQNVTGLTVGGITGIAKQGHHALWIEFEDAVESGEAKRRPKTVHIERVYDSVSFGALFGFA